MKRSFYFFALLGLLFVLPACQKEVVVEDGLTSPSGQRLASDRATLGNMIEEYYAVEFGTEISTEVSQVTWEKRKGQEFAIVKYVNSQGELANFAIARVSAGGTGDPGSLDPVADPIGVDPVVTCDNITCPNPCALGTRKIGEFIIWVCPCLRGGEPGEGCEVKGTTTGN